MVVVSTADRVERNGEVFAINNEGGLSSSA
jgi:hypothetical protein